MRSARRVDGPSPSTAAKPKKRKTRGFWVRQLHSWHWISSALALVGMLLFTLTGFTLNHAADIEAEPKVTHLEAQLDPEALKMLAPFEDGQNAPLPSDVRREAGSLLGITLPAAPAEWTEQEAYLPMPRPGGDAWISIDRVSGAIAYERTDRGWIAYFNDLHKGRNTGGVWSWFIDLFVVVATLFTLTGFILLFMHARNRPLTWPVTGLGFVIPLLLAMFFIH
ncbi:hypothetical protein MB02_07815 [Croceicoccus estronivorus]|nr:hypothetical protein MB02_07815 [Croceicoccus estronivorus]